MSEKERQGAGRASRQNPKRGYGVGDSKHLRLWQAVARSLCSSSVIPATTSADLISPSSHPNCSMRLVERGFNRDDARVWLSNIVSLGTLAYAAGKFIFGATGDLIGGRRNFLGGMTGAVLFTALFAMGGSFPLFSIAWVGNRFVQASGWPGLVKIAGRWFDYRWYGTALAILSLSYLFGDSAARAYMGMLQKLGLGWRGLFFVTALNLAGVLVVCYFFLKESPQAIGETEGNVNPTNVYGNQPTVGIYRNIDPPAAKPGLLVRLLSFAGHDILARNLQQLDDRLLQGRGQVFGLKCDASEQRFSHFLAAARCCLPAYSATGWVALVDRSLILIGPSSRRVYSLAGVESDLADDQSMGCRCCSRIHRLSDDWSLFVPGRRGCTRFWR